MSQREKREGLFSGGAKDMTKGNPARLLLAFTLPMLFGNIFQQIYNLVDSVVVGKFVGSSELGGIGCTGSIHYLIFSIGYGMAVGVGVLISMLYGAGDEKKLSKAIYNSFYVLLGAALLITLVGGVKTEAILRLMDTPETVLSYAVTYLRITAFGSFASMLYNGLFAIMEAFGDFRTPLLVMIFSCLCNVALDLVTVLGLGMGVAGVALATVIAQLLAALVSFLYVYRRIPCFRLRPGAARPDRELLVKILRLGLPIAGQNALIAVSCIVLQVVVNGFGEAIVTANTAVSKIEQLVQQPFTSLSSALTAFTGQNIGARRYDRVRRGFRTGCMFVVVSGALMLVIMQLFGRQLLGWFVSEPEIVDIGAGALRITSWFYVFLGLIYVVRGTLNGAGDTGYSALNGVIELCCRIGLAYPLTRIPEVGMWGCFLCSGLTWTITGLLSLWRYLAGSWQKIARRREEGPGSKEASVL